MDLEKAVKILEEHQIWRRGAETKMQHPKLLGIAIDLILSEVKSKILKTEK